MAAPDLPRAVTTGVRSTRSSARERCERAVRARVAPAASALCRACQFFPRGVCCGGHAGEEAGQPSSADPQGEAVEELNRRGPEGEGNIPAETGVPPKAGGEERPVRSKRIGAALRVHPLPGAVSCAGQRWTPVASADRNQAAFGRRVNDRHRPAQ
jgi:hypothetical protein